MNSQPTEARRKAFRRAEWLILKPSPGADESLHGLAGRGSMHWVFLLACLVSAVAFALSWLLQEVPLRKA
ncbi:hypothetical protein BWR15_16055 [Pseudomonas sp. T]|nr:hypothetical protein BWR15_16055 [Pseudomonas sp. T]